MTAIFKKLNNRCGASIVLALLLFLICALSGAAALTTAWANVDRYSYQEEDQQAYLTAASAARLIRRQLDGLTVEAEYKFEIPDDEAHFKAVGDPLTVPHTSHHIEKISDGIFTDASDFTIKRYDEEIADTKNDMVRFLEDNLKTINKATFKNYISDNSPKEYLWKCDALTSYSQGAIDETITLNIDCTGLDTATVEINFTEETDYDGKKVTVTVMCKEIKYEMEGTIEVKETSFDNEEESPVTIPCTVIGCVADDGTTPNTGIDYYILKSTQKTVISLNFKDAVISRVKDDGGEPL